MPNHLDHGPILGGVPMQGWTYIAIEDVHYAQHRCEACGTAWVRYIHVMEHTEHPCLLRVGCVCAGRLENAPRIADEREAAFRARQSRRNKWLTRGGWRLSKKGNSYINVDHCNVTVFPAEDRWGYRVLHRASGVGWLHEEPEPTEEAAKWAAFDKLPKYFPEFHSRIQRAQRAKHHKLAPICPCKENQP